MGVCVCVYYPLTHGDHEFLASSNGDEANSGALVYSTWWNGDEVWAVSVCKEEWSFSTGANNLLLECGASTTRDAMAQPCLPDLHMRLLYAKLWCAADKMHDGSKDVFITLREYS